MSKIITYSFCESFIDNLARYLEENYIKKGKDISRLAIVFGGKRPALFIKRELAQRIKTSFYPPKFFTIDQFISYTVSQNEMFTSPQDLDSCYLLYKLAQEITPKILKGKETFAQFLPWTREILAFIDQLDLENVDDKALTSIEANAEIGYAVPEDINKLLSSVVALRQAYHKKLKKGKKYSRGFQYLRAAELIQDINFKEFDEILFCNFFYFNRSEEKVIKTLYEKNKATLIFQGDERKWPILKRLANRFDCTLKEGEQPDKPKFDFKLYAGFDAHSQVGMVREIIKKIKNIKDTVIVLPNPDLIVPLLSEISSEVKEFNISMGYPLKRSSLYTLFEFLFKAQISKREGRYYAKDYLKILRHPFIKNLKLSVDSATTRILIHKIEEILTGKERTNLSGSLFLDLDEVVGSDEIYSLTKEMAERVNIKTTRKELKDLLEEIHLLAFESWDGVSSFHDFAQTLKKFLDAVVEKSFLKNYPLNLNIASKIYDIKDEFEHSSFSKEHFPLEEIFRIFDAKVAREIVAFVGSPLKGMQVLGLFETRSLNFENVIILDVNEGSLPRLRIYEPLIPREVMISLNLDRLELEEEIQRYQFMRLISSAKNVHLVYQESRDKERSRFVEQLIWAEQKKSESIKISPVTRPCFSVEVASQEKRIKKTPKMIECLKKHVYSASSINTYLRDPMEFYTNYVLRLREKEDLLDEPEARHVGTFVHELLEDVFLPFVNKKPKIDAGFCKRFEERFEEKFEASFGKSMKSDSFLLKSVLRERMRRFLENEQKNEERQIEEILYLENKFDDVIPLSCGDIRFSYIVDRVDRLKNGTIMIIDYKTGSIDQMPKGIQIIESMTLSRENIKENIRSFQIPLYYQYLDKQFRDQPINAALYNLRTLEFKKFDKDMKFDRKHVNTAFLKALDFIVSEILNPKVDFIASK